MPSYANLNEAVAAMTGGAPARAGAGRPAAGRPQVPMPQARPLVHPPVRRAGTLYYSGNQRAPFEPAFACFALVCERFGLL